MKLKMNMIFRLKTSIKSMRRVAVGLCGYANYLVYVFKKDELRNNTS